MAAVCPQTTLLNQQLARPATCHAPNSGHRMQLSRAPARTSSRLYAGVSSLQQRVCSRGSIQLVAAPWRARQSCSSGSAARLPATHKLCTSTAAGFERRSGILATQPLGESSLACDDISRKGTEVEAARNALTTTQDDAKLHSSEPAADGLQPSAPAVSSQSVTALALALETAGAFALYSLQAEASAATLQDVAGQDSILLAYTAPPGSLLATHPPAASLPVSSFPDPVLGSVLGVSIPNSTQLIPHPPFPQVNALSVLRYLSHYPILVLVLAGLLVWGVPRLVKAGVRYVVVPAALLTGLYLAVTNPNSSWAFLQTVWHGASDHPYIFSALIVIGLALALSPYILVALALLVLFSGVQLLPAPLRPFLPGPLVEAEKQISRAQSVLRLPGRPAPELRSSPSTSNPRQGLLDSLTSRFRRQQPEPAVQPSSNKAGVSSNNSGGRSGRLVALDRLTSSFRGQQPEPAAQPAVPQAATSRTGSGSAREVLDGLVSKFRGGQQPSLLPEQAPASLGKAGVPSSSGRGYDADAGISGRSSQGLGRGFLDTLRSRVTGQQAVSSTERAPLVSADAGMPGRSPAGSSTSPPESSAQPGLGSRVLRRVNQLSKEVRRAAEQRFPIPVRQPGLSTGAQSETGLRRGDGDQGHNKKFPDHSSSNTGSSSSSSGAMQVADSSNAANGRQAAGSEFRSTSGGQASERWAQLRRWATAVVAHTRQQAGPVLQKGLAEAQQRASELSARFRV